MTSKILPWRFSAVLLLRKACPKSGSPEVDPEFDMGCQVSYEDFHVLIARVFLGEALSESRGESWKVVESRGKSLKMVEMQRKFARERGSGRKGVLRDLLARS